MNTIELAVDIGLESSVFPELIEHVQKNIEMLREESIENCLAKIANLTFQGSIEGFLFIGSIIKMFIQEEVTKTILSQSLAFVGVAMDAMTLAKNSYETHQAHQAEKAFEKILNEFKANYIVDQDSTKFEQLKLLSLEKKLMELKEDSFRKEVKTAYRTIYLIASTLIAASLACPPLLLVGGGVFFAALIADLIDHHTDLKLSRFIAKQWHKLFHEEKLAFKKEKQHSHFSIQFFKPKNKKASVVSEIEMTVLPAMGCGNK